jgi:hypothetical protein
VADFVEERPDVGVQYPVHPPAFDPDDERVQRIMRAASGPKPIRELAEFFLVNLVQQGGHCPLDDLVLQCSNRERALPPVRLGYVDPPRRLCPVRSTLDPFMQVLEPGLEVCLVVLPRQPIDARRSVRLEFIERHFEQFDADVVEERGELLLPLLLCDFPYAFQRL